MERWRKITIGDFMTSSHEESLEPTLESRTPVVPRLGSRYRAVRESLAVGLLLGFADTNLTDTEGLLLCGYFFAGAFIGLRHAGRACPCWPILGVSLYLVHVVAIACGRTPPYVEENYRFAEQCLWVIMPSGLGIMAGAGLRVALSEFDRLHGKFVPPVRFLPRSTREVMVVVACLGIWLGCLKQMIFPPTIYAPGYDEYRFHSIRPGMTSEQVVKALGTPLQVRSSLGGEKTWEYSTQYTYTSDYHRRWIYVKDGVVQGVVSDYWFD